MPLSQLCVSLVVMANSASSQLTAPNEYEEIDGAGVDIWRSTSDFVPEHSASFGTITIGETMRTEFDFVYRGRSTAGQSQYDNFFRVGFSANSEYNDCSTPAGYPSFWVYYVNNLFPSMFVSIADGADCKSFNAPLDRIEVNVSYHVVIAFNATSANIAVTSDTINSTYTQPRFYGVDAAHLGATAQVWFMSDKLTGEYVLGNGILSNVVITSTDYDIDEPTTGAPTSTTTTTSVSTSASCSETNSQLTELNKCEEIDGGAGVDIWRSTSDFVPEQSASFGSITIGETMRTEFDFVYRGRSTAGQSQYENFFRVGFGANSKYNDCSTPAGYPSFWVYYKNNLFPSMFVSIADGDDCKSFNAVLDRIEVNVSYHVVIAFNATFATIAVTSDTINTTYTQPRYYGVDPAHVGATAQVWFMSDKPGINETYLLGNGVFSNVVITSTDYPTDEPTAEPTPAPTAYPSIEPTVEPTTGAPSTTTTRTSTESPASGAPSETYAVFGGIMIILCALI